MPIVTKDLSEPKRKINAEPPGKAPKERKPFNPITLLALVPLVGAGIMLAVYLQPHKPDPRQRQASECLRNMRTITSIKEEMASANHWRVGTELPSEVIELMDQKGLTQCPGGGEVSVGAVGRSVECSMHGTVHDWAREHNMIID